VGSIPTLATNNKNKKTMEKKKFKMEITHDRLRDGDFPVRQLGECGITAVRDSEKSARFSEIWYLSSEEELSEEERVEIAYSIGKLVEQCSRAYQ